MLEEQPTLTWMKSNKRHHSPQTLLQGMSQGFRAVCDFDVPLDFKNLTAQKIKLYTETILEKTVEIYDHIASLDKTQASLSFRTVMQPFIDSDIQLARLECLAVNMKSFSPDKSIREACVASGEALQNCAIESHMRHDAYKTIARYYEENFAGEKESLSHEECRFVEDMIRGYRRSGLHLDEKIRERITHLKQGIAKNHLEFSNNVSEENTSFVLSKKQLKGMPEDWFTEARHVKNDLYKVTLKYPDIVPAMDYVKDPNIRKKLFTAFNSRCMGRNSELFDETIKMRHELATLLGYESYADFQIEPKMAGTAAKAQQFLTEMNDRFTPLLEQDIAAMTALAVQETGRFDYQLKPWDMRYYLRQNLEQQNEINMEEVKQYFPLNVTLKGMFQVYEKLLGLKFIEEDTDNKWHEEVKVYTVYNQDTAGDVGSEVGRFYLDLHPREGKFGHAAVFPFIAGCDLSKQPGFGQERRLPVCAMACNFPANSCLPFGDVVTLFHEFGHVMHNMCGKTQLAQYHGTKVQRDFVEAPSQMLENWCYSPSILKRLSAHQVTGESLPETLIEKLNAQKKINQGYSSKRQLSFGLFDLALHSSEVGGKRHIDSQHLWYRIQDNVIGFHDPSNTHFAAAFGHLMGGYQAGYYGYMMSNTYAADMFYSVFKDDPMNRAMGKRYRECILEPGGSKDAGELLEDFLGRKPSIDAFLEDCGLTEAKEPLAKLEVASRR